MLAASPVPANEVLWLGLAKNPQRGLVATKVWRYLPALLLVVVDSPAACGAMSLRLCQTASSGRLGP